MGQLAETGRSRVAEKVIRFSILNFLIFSWRWLRFSVRAQAATGAAGSLHGRQIIFTPPVMDFDKISDGPPALWQILSLNDDVGSG